MDKPHNMAEQNVIFIYLFIFFNYAIAGFRSSQEYVADKIYL